MCCFSLYFNMKPAGFGVSVHRVVTGAALVYLPVKYTLWVFIGAWWEGRRARNIRQWPTELTEPHTPLTWTTTTAGNRLIQNRNKTQLTNQENKSGSGKNQMCPGNNIKFIRALFNSRIATSTILSPKRTQLFYWVNFIWRTLRSIIHMHIMHTNGRRHCWQRDLDRVRRRAAKQTRKLIGINEEFNIPDSHSATVHNCIQPHYTTHMPAVRPP